jgi:hypothetical protein
MLATGNAEGLLRVWNPTDGWLMHEFNACDGHLRRAVFSPG